MDEHFSEVAQSMPSRARQSMLEWMLESTGPFYSFALPALGLLVFIGVCLVVFYSRRPSVIAAFVVFLPAPLLLGIFGTVTGVARTFSVISMGGGTPDPNRLAEGIAAALLTTQVGLLVSLPAYVVFAIGLFLRTVFAGNARYDY
jgi:hypothetical protein